MVASSRRGTWPPTVAARPDEAFVLIIKRALQVGCPLVLLRFVGGLRLTTRRRSLHRQFCCSAREMRKTNDRLSWLHLVLLLSPLIVIGVFSLMQSRELGRSLNFAQQIITTARLMGFNRSEVAISNSAQPVLLSKPYRFSPCAETGLAGLQAA